jgi:hypothetical protein
MTKSSPKFGEKVITNLEAARPVSDPSTAILRGAGIPAGAAVLVTAAGFGAGAGMGEGASVVLGGVMAVAALAVAPIVQRLTKRLDPAMVLGIAVLAYSVVMLLVGVTYGQVNDISWVHSAPAGLGALVAILAWSAGHIWTSQRMRELLYDSE